MLMTAVLIPQFTNAATTATEEAIVKSVRQQQLQQLFLD
jgi:hypothetical protein